MQMTDSHFSRGGSFQRNARWVAMRVCLLVLAAGLPGGVAGAAQEGEAESGSIRLKGREVFFECPGPGIRAEGQSFYTRRDGVEKMRYRMLQSKSDKMDAMERSFSSDNGRTWSAPEAVVLKRKTAVGFERKGHKAGWIDPVNGRLLFMGGRSVLPTDSPLESLTRGQIWYSVSNDGGRTFAIEEQVIQEGAGYTSEHPLDGVWLGRNAVAYGDRGGRPIRTRRGHVLQPVQITLPGENGKPANPGGGYTYTESAVLIGTWQDDGRMKWQLSQRVSNTPEQSSRGALEPTIAELPDRRVLMVMRGSNTKTTPGFKWHSFSADGGFTWSAIQPWTYSDGKRFFSPSSCSQLVTHSNGRIYWLGNITPKPPQGNGPRYPFVIGRVDLATGLLIRESIVTIDDRREGDNAALILSNFMAHEDRENGDILLHMSRAFATSGFTSDAYLYRIGVGR